MKTILLSVIIFILFIGCSSRSSYDKTLNHIDSLLSYQIDSLPAVKMILDREKDSYLTEYSLSQQMRYRLLYAKWQNLSYVPFTTDVTMKQVVAWYNQHGTANEKMLAWYLLGCTYRDLIDAPRAVDAFNQGEKSADTLRSDCDYRTLCRICGQKSALYHLQMLPRKSLDELNQGVYYALKGGDTLSAISLFNHKFGDYEMLGNLDSAIIINEKAYKEFNKFGYTAQAVMALGANIDNYTKKRRYKEAYEAIKRYDRESGLFKNGEIEKGREIYYSLKGFYYLSVHQLDSSEYYYRKELAKGMDSDNQRTATEGLLHLYKIRHISDSIVKYALASKELEDSFLANQQKQTLNNLDKIYNYQESQRILEQKEKENVSLKFTAALMIIVGMIIISCGVVFYYRKRSIHQKKLAELQTLYIRTLQELRRLEETFAEVKSEANSHPDDELYKKAIKEKEQQIQILKQKIQEYDSDVLKEDAFEEGIKSTDIFLRFEQLCSSCKVPTEMEWEELTSTVESLIPNFRKTMMRNVPLSDDEYRICVLVRLNFRPKDIGNLLDGRFSNLTVSRIRLLKKIFGKNGTAKDFSRLIRNVK